MPRQLWWQKHRPSTIDNFIFQSDEQEKFIRRCGRGPSREIRRLVELC